MFTKRFVETLYGAAKFAMRPFRWRLALACPDLFISDKCMGLLESPAEFYPEAQWQRCTVHWYRNVLSVVPRGQMKAAADKREQMKLRKAAQKVREGAAETLSYYAFPREHHRHLYTNNPLEAIMLDGGHK